MNLKTCLILLPSALVVTGDASAQESKPFATFMEMPWRYVIGGSAGGKWLSSETAGKRLAAKTSYRIFTLEGEKAKITAGKAAPEADVCMDVYMHAITPEPDPQSPDAIGVNAPWNPQPRQPVPLDIDKASLEKALGDLLNGKGLKNPKVMLTQTVRVDLDGDGKLETLLTGQHFHDEIEHLEVKAGDYSLVFVRRLVGEQVKTQILAGEAYPKADPENAPSTYEIAGVLDLDGDGKLEVLVRTGYYEGGGMQIWQLKGDRLVKVLEMECGV